MSLATDPNQPMPSDDPVLMEVNRDLRRYQALTEYLRECSSSAPDFKAMEKAARDHANA
jgi:hypothetical protein